MKQILAKAICPHRGIGDENSLIAIRSAVKNKPFMVEFDVQNIGGKLYLGHPPLVNLDVSVAEALIEFENSNVIPKIDLKCSIDWKTDIDLLLIETNSVKTNMIINIGGDNLDQNEFVEAEKYLLLHSEANYLLNIDIERYGNLGDIKILNHIRSLDRGPYSVSPKMEGDFDKEIDLATSSGIKNIHFWSNNSATYSEHELEHLINYYNDQGFNVLFDIKSNIII